MPKLIEAPTRIAAAGEPPKLIEEFIGRVNSATGALSIAKMTSPAGWSEPKKVYDGGPWYPQVVGTNAAEHETDKRAGRSARLFLRGNSKWEIVFLKPGEAAP